MKKNLFILLPIGIIFLIAACTKEEEEQTTFDDSTRQTVVLKNESTSKKVEILEEMGALPIVKFYSIDEEDSVTVNPGESQTAQAPLNLELLANVSNPDNYKYICEWRIWRTSDNGSENNPLATRFEEDTQYKLTRSGGYGIKLYITFSLDGDTIEYESDPISVVVSESKLTCPDGFSPNEDGINDSLRITVQSIIELDAKFFNRWGQEIHSVTLATAKHAVGEPNKLILWDGNVKGKRVSDGVYMLHLKALGSDGVKYKIKKAISVLTGYKENSETNTEGSGT